MKIPKKHQKIIKHFLECFFYNHGPNKEKCMHCSDCIVSAINMRMIKQKEYQDSLWPESNFMDDDILSKIVMACDKFELPCPRAIKLQDFTKYLLRLKPEELEKIRKIFPCHTELKQYDPPKLLFTNPI